MVLGPRARGPYSVVWFDALDLEGVEYVSGYVAKDGKVVESSCAKNSVQVRPWGRNDQYPPTAATGVMQGFEVVFDLGLELLKVNVTTGAILQNLEGVYVRAEGGAKATVKGGPDSGEVYHGRVLMEEFKFAGSGL